MIMPATVLFWLWGAGMGCINTTPSSSPTAPPAPSTPGDVSGGGGGSSSGGGGDVVPPAETPAPAEEAEAETEQGALARLKGRRVWMVNASEAACAQAEALGLVVDCEPSRPGAAQAEVVSWCPQVSRASLEALRAALGVGTFVIRSWEDQPEEQDTEECGAFAEITVRY